MLWNPLPYFDTVPLPPSVTAITGTGVATVTWIPISDGGAAITRYIVTPYLNGRAQDPVR